MYKKPFRISSIIISTTMILISLAISARAKAVKYVFNVRYHAGAPDGVHTGNILGINGQFPGPTIHANLGDILEVLVINNIEDGQNTSIHWHGIHQRTTPFEDGTYQISQCPLRAGENQLYRFQLQQSGTYWYHSHVHCQYSEGLWGILIIHNHREVYFYDAHIIITLSDWFHQPAKVNEVWHLSPASRGNPPYQNSGLLNGYGRYPCNVASLQNSSCDPALQKRLVFQVLPHKTYRIRVINTSATSAFNFSIDGHRLTTIEVDGVDVARPGHVTDIVPIAAAQRYSFLIHTNNLPMRYLIRANLRKEFLMLVGGANINKHAGALMGDVTAVLEYNRKKSNPEQPAVKFGLEPHSYLDQVPPMNTQGMEYLDQNALTPFDRIYSPPYFDQQFILQSTFSEDHENIRRGSFNKTPFVLPQDKPILMSLLDGEVIPKSVFPLEIAYMNVIQVVINNPFLGPHPFHLHGHHFWVLGSGPWHDGDYNSSLHNLTLTGARRDTVLVLEKSWAVIRFIADNPGVWTFHCHIDWHNLSGLALTFIEAKEIARATIRITEEARRVCMHRMTLRP